jgi:hypothetical protein
MPKKIAILPTPEELKKVADTTYVTLSKGRIPFELATMEFVANEIRIALAKEVGRHMWTRLVELGMLHEGHDCTQYERTGHSPDHSPFCRTCRAKKELELK